MILLAGMYNQPACAGIQLYQFVVEQCAQLGDIRLAVHHVTLREWWQVIAADAEIPGSKVEVDCRDMYQLLLAIVPDLAMYGRRFLGISCARRE